MQVKNARKELVDAEIKLLKAVNLGSSDLQEIQAEVERAEETLIRTMNGEPI